MSLIETALDKLRRAEAIAEAQRPQAPARPSGVTPLVPSTPVLPQILDENRPKITVDVEQLRQAGYLPERASERRFADHFRRVKRPLIEKAIAGTSEMRLIMVTSALPGDGKTFTSINLAFSMARERDISVLLVDADGARARISEVLKIRQQQGLLDALADESIDVESLVMRTDVRGLEVLPAGHFIDSSTELIASGRMAQVAVRLAAHNPRRLVLLDSAPLLVSSDARVLMRTPGQIVLVVRAGVTPRRAIMDAVSQVDKQKLQGLVVNQVRDVPGEDYYGYPPYEDVADSAHGATTGSK
ncbi:MAG: AAA family ATPase [Proteobacteria bacterium]|nr:AAA family ATPase [Pseudomonadota bacterium]